MASNQPEGLIDDFFDQILAVPSSYPGNDNGNSGGGGGNYGTGDGNLAGTPSAAMMLQLGSGEGGSGAGGAFRRFGLPMGLNFEEHQRSISPSSSTPIIERDRLQRTSMFPAFGQMQPPIRPQAPGPTHPQLHQPFHGQPTSGAVPAAPNPTVIRPKIRARRGQATDPHSIAERLRRERIAERVKALQELVPSASKTDRAAMLDDIVDYVKFLRLQVKVLSMSRIGGAGAVAQLVSDVSLLSIKEEGLDDGANEQAWEKWSTDGTEQEVAKLMEDDVGSAMQFLQSKGLCIMPISLARAIFRTQQQDASALVVPEPNSNSGCPNENMQNS